LGSRRQRQQRRVMGEVRGGAGRRFGETACAAHGKPGAGQPEGENLIGVHPGDGYKESGARARKEIYPGRE
jgi:hypothetical protein